MGGERFVLLDKCDGKLGPSIVRISDAKIPWEVEQKLWEMLKSLASVQHEH